jgi:putative transposase
MANTYTQLYVQFVFSVKGRENLIKEKFRDELEKVMSGIVSAHKSKTYTIYCNPDHVHIFIGLHPIISVSKLIEQVKSGSSNWLNDKKYIAGKFSWQDGYGAFTYSKSHIDKVVKYILTQSEHHKKQSFKEEYLSFLSKFEIDYDPNYLFEWYNEI